MSVIKEFAIEQGRRWEEIFKAEELTATNYEIIRN
jgi:hypothetical protein